MILKDEDANSRKWPSRDVVLDHLEILVKDAKPGDRLFLHCKARHCPSPL